LQRLREQSEYIGSPVRRHGSDEGGSARDRQVLNDLLGVIGSGLLKHFDSPIERHGVNNACRKARILNVQPFNDVCDMLRRKVAGNGDRSLLIRVRIPRA
jgi:hypothetical protein